MLLGGFDSHRLPPFLALLRPQKTAGSWGPGTVYGNIFSACGSMGEMRSLFLISLWFCSGPAQAETTTRTFLEQHAEASEDGRRVLIGFIHGLIAGYTWTNVTLKADGQCFVSPSRVAGSLRNRCACSKMRLEPIQYCSTARWVWPCW